MLLDQELGPKRHRPEAASARSGTGPSGHRPSGIGKEGDLVVCRGLMRSATHSRRTSRASRQHRRIRALRVALTIAARQPQPLAPAFALIAQVAAAVPVYCGESPGSSLLCCKPLQNLFTDEMALSALSLIGKNLRLVRQPKSPIRHGSCRVVDSMLRRPSRWGYSERRPLVFD